MRTYIFFVGSLLLLSACSKSAESPLVSSDMSKPVYLQELDKVSPKIKDAPAFETCMSPSISMCVNQVGNQLAREQNSPEFCDEIVDINGRDACKYGVIMTQVLESKNIELCQTLSDTYKKECKISYYMMDAMNTKDYKKCDQVTAELSTQSWSSNPIFDRAEQCRVDVIMRSDISKLTDCDIIKDSRVKDMCVATLKNRAQ